jgi:type VI secretion system protein ImpC
VSRLDNDGNLLKLVPVGAYPTGVAVDALGKVWVTNLNSHDAYRIDPNGGLDGLGEVDLVVPLGAGAGPYNYSDMTGVVAIGSTAPQGTWTVVHDGGLPGAAWGNAAWTFAANVHQSFAKYRWCTNIIGPLGGGAVEGLPVYLFESMGAIDTKIPTEVLLSDRREFELAEQGFMALTMRKGSDNAAFFSANSCQRPKTYADTAEGRAAQTNYTLGTQLPYLFIVNRLAHYIKVIQRENIGTWKERTDLERELNAWISQYVADMDNPQADVRSRRPLRKAAIEVSDVDGNPGWYKVGIKVRPHMKYMGAHFTLSLVGKLDKD